MRRPGTSIMVFFALFSAALAQAGQMLFPRPPTLQPAIAFWTRVFTEVDSNAGFVHDSRNLTVVYETLKFKPTDSNRRQQQRIEEALEPPLRNRRPAPVGGKAPSADLGRAACGRSEGV